MLLPCAVACCGMLLVLLSAVCAVVLSGVLRSDAALWRRRVVCKIEKEEYSEKDFGWKR